MICFWFLGNRTNNSSLLLLLLLLLLSVNTLSLLLAYNDNNNNNYFGGGGGGVGGGVGGKYVSVWDFNILAPQDITSQQQYYSRDLNENRIYHYPRMNQNEEESIIDPLFITEVRRRLEGGDDTTSTKNNEGDSKTVEVKNNGKTTSSSTNNNVEITQNEEEEEEEEEEGTTSFSPKNTNNNSGSSVEKVVEGEEQHDDDDEEETMNQNNTQENGIMSSNNNNKNNKNGTSKSGEGTEQQEGKQQENHLVVKVEEEEEQYKYHNFIPHNKTRTCTADSHATPFTTQVRGVNLGGWMVLEPWITPSLFYQFLGRQGMNETAMDTYTFCSVLGPREGNKQLHRHWSAWVTKDYIKQLHELHVNSIRLPVGDWMYEPYGPYVGCTDGALDYIDKVLNWAALYNISVLIDIHAMKDSQNGFDNSGRTMGMEFTTQFNTYPAGLATFQHWPIRSAHWFGIFDRENQSYPIINYDNIAHSLKVVTKIAQTYHNHSAVLGLEPVNEPWEFTPLNELKQYYWESYLIVKRYAPKWKFVIHDSFRFDVKIWGGFMKGCPDRAIDAHIYQAWRTPASRVTFYNDACSQIKIIANMEVKFGPVIVGEWSLGTDNCAMWLNGFNDNLPGFPMLPCKYTPCAESYMKGQPGTPIDPGKPLQGPYGTGISGPSWGLCPTGRDWFKEHSDDPTTGTDWIRAPAEAPPTKDATNEVMTNLARKKIYSFSYTGHGFYFWNFRTELIQPQWNYLHASKLGWIPKGKNDFQTDHIRNACKREQNGIGYRCVSNRNVLERELKNGVALVLAGMGKNSTYINKMHGKELNDEADKLYDAYWKKNFVVGMTCDFGGTAQLVLQANSTWDDDQFDDDWTDDFSVEISRNNKNILTEKILWLVGGIVVGAITVGIGFVYAMRRNKRFNMHIRESKMFRHFKNSGVFHGSGAFLGSEKMPFIPNDNDDVANGSAVQHF